MRRAVFLDKDGTLIEDVPYNVDPARIALRPGARGALTALRAAGFALVVVTNQSGVARGLFEERALDAVRARIEALLGFALDGWYHCPHLGGCHCRKPEPGLVRRAAAELDIDLEASWMVGDILNDVEAGNRAGCRTILIEPGGETEWVDGPYRRADHECATLAEVADAILVGERLAA